MFTYETSNSLWSVWLFNAVDIWRILRRYLTSHPYKLGYPQPTLNFCVPIALILKFFSSPSPSPNLFSYCLYMSRRYKTNLGSYKF